MSCPFKEEWTEEYKYGLVYFCERCNLYQEKCEDQDCWYRTGNKEKDILYLVNNYFKLDKNKKVSDEVTEELTPKPEIVKDIIVRMIKTILEGEKDE